MCRWDHALQILAHGPGMSKAGIVRSEEADLSKPYPYHEKQVSQAVIRGPGSVTGMC